MKRPISFRYYYTNDKAWLKYDFDLIEICNGHPFEILSDSPFPGSKDYRNVAYVQSTGLKDKNGKMIYEGDIIALQSIAKYKVVFENGAFGYYTGPDEYDYFVSFAGNAFNLDVFKGKCKQARVIGNIYENPELIPA